MFYNETHLRDVFHNAISLIFDATAANYMYMANNIISSEHLWLSDIGILTATTELSALFDAFADIYYLNWVKKNDHIASLTVKQPSYLDINVSESRDLKLW